MIETLTMLLYAIYLFATVGTADWLIKELPMYPQKRPDSFFWQKAWGIVCWLTPTLILVYLYHWLALAFLPLILIEDQTYFLWRKLVYKEPYTDTLYFPWKMFGRTSLPMLIIQRSTVQWIGLIIGWALGPIFWK